MLHTNKKTSSQPPIETYVMNTYAYVHACAKYVCSHMSCTHFDLSIKNCRSVFVSKLTANLYVLIKETYGPACQLPRALLFTRALSDALSIYDMQVRIYVDTYTPTRLWHVHIYLAIYAIFLYIIFIWLVVYSYAVSPVSASVSALLTIAENTLPLSRTSTHAKQDNSSRYKSVEGTGHGFHCTKQGASGQVATKMNIRDVSICDSRGLITSLTPGTIGTAKWCGDDGVCGSVVCDGVGDTEPILCRSLFY